MSVVLTIDSTPIGDHVEMILPYWSRSVMPLAQTGIFKQNAQLIDNGGNIVRGDRIIIAVRPGDPLTKNMWTNRASINGWRSLASGKKSLAITGTDANNVAVAITEANAYLISIMPMNDPRSRPEADFGLYVVEVQYNDAEAT